MNRAKTYAVVCAIFLFTSIFLISADPISEDSIPTGSDACEIAMKKDVWTKISEGMWTADLQLYEGDDNERLKLVKLDQATYRAEIVRAQDFGKERISVKDMVNLTKSSVGINASYFDENYSPLGFLKTKGKIRNDYIAEPIIYSGVLALNNGRLTILHRDSFKKSDWFEALQAGPRLIADSKQTIGVEDTIDYREKARRAGIGVDKKGFVVLAVTAGGIASWKQIIKTLLSAKIEIKTFMNLDGGSSAQVYAESNGKTLIDERTIGVPVGVCFKHK